jgi:hypothetical protein
MDGQALDTSNATYEVSLQANLLGSSVGLFAAYHMERHYRYRREVISNLVVHVDLSIK